MAIRHAIEIRRQTAKRHLKLNINMDVMAVCGFCHRPLDRWRI